MNTIDNNTNMIWSDYKYAVSELYEAAKHIKSGTVYNKVRIAKKSFDMSERLIGPRHFSSSQKRIFLTPSVSRRIIVNPNLESRISNLESRNPKQIQHPIISNAQNHLLWVSGI